MKSASDERRNSLVVRSALHGVSRRWTGWRKKIKNFLIKISGRGDILLFSTPEGVSPIPHLPHMGASPPTLHRRTFENAVLLPINR